MKPTRAKTAPPVSAGVLAWRDGPQGPQVLLVHPGGPYWSGKDAAAWSIPKGLVEPGEASWAAAVREFQEELGVPISGEAEPLTPVRLPGGKIVLAWLVKADPDLSRFRSNTFEIEWPPRSGRRRTYPEADRAAWFDLGAAGEKIHKGQRPLLAEAARRLCDSPDTSSLGMG
jgi:predicted NUDIX family NTP pyrophosphohydrolase